MRIYLKYEVLLLFGILLALGTLLKLLLHLNIDSDWFWFFAGVAITVEGAINLSKQKQFDKKYKVVLRDEK